MKDLNTLKFKFLVLAICTLGWSFSSIAQVFSEGFEGGALPTGWTQEYEGGAIDWTVAGQNGTGNVTPRTGSGMAEFRVPSFSGATKLVTPSIDLTTLNAPQLTFYFANESWGTDVDELRIYYKSSAGDAWTQLGPDYVTAHSSWEEVEVLLPNASADYYLAFEGTTNYARGLDIDDISIDEGPHVLTLPY